MKGLSVILTVILLLLAVWLPGRLKAVGKLPVQDAAKSSVPSLNVAKAPAALRPVRL